MPNKPIPISVENVGGTTITADLTGYQTGAIARLVIRGETISTNWHRFDHLWWSPVISRNCMAMDEYGASLFPDSIPNAVAVDTWQRMWDHAKPHLDLRAWRLARVAGDAMRLYEALAYDPALVKLVQKYRAAGPLLAYHRSFAPRGGEALEEQFSRLVREAGPVVRSYVPGLCPDVVIPDNLSSFFVKWAKAIRFTPRHRAPYAEVLGTMASLVLVMAATSTTWTEEGYARLRTPKERLLLNEAVVRSAWSNRGLPTMVLADPAAVVAVVEDMHNRDPDLPWPLLAAEFLGRVEALCSEQGTLANRRSATEWAEVVGFV